MNRSKLRTMGGSRVYIWPRARRLHHYTGIELPPMEDTYLVGLVVSNFPISLSSTGHGIVLAFDNIHHFDEHPNGGPGTLVLRSQLWISGNRAWLTPLDRPGMGEETMLAAYNAWDRRLDAEFHAAVLSSNPELCRPFWREVSKY